MTEAVQVEGHVVNITVPNCPGFVPRSNPVDIKESLLGRHVLQTRDAANLERRDTATSNASPSECAIPSICECGTPCTSVPSVPPSLDTDHRVLTHRRRDLWSGSTRI